MEQNTYYFVGIKGTGMASLARILHDKGHQVLGSDIEKETFTQAPLLAAGIKILPFDPANLKPGMIVIQGNAFDDDHPEIKRAHELDLKILSYPEAVENEVKNHTSIGIAGAHGKTSTTALLSHVLAAVEPTSYLIGDGVGKGNADARFFVFEADEYRDHFLAYHPDYAIMTNVDFDHPDYFNDLADVRDSFETYGKQVQRAIFAWGDDPSLRNLNVDVPVYYYGTNPDDDFRAENIQRTPEGSTYDAYFRDQKLGTFTIHLYGEHSVLNSLAVLAVAYMEHMNMDEIQQELANFSGVKRRFSETDIADITIIDDYAHHQAKLKQQLMRHGKSIQIVKLSLFFNHTHTHGWLLTSMALQNRLAGQIRLLLPQSLVQFVKMLEMFLVLIWSNGLTVVKALTWIPWINFCNTIMQ